MLINLYSGTQTRPVEAMRAAMAAAEVGDEQRGEDPTVTALCERVVALLGKPAAVFLPSAALPAGVRRADHQPGGWAVWPLQQVRAVLEVAARHRLRTHLQVLAEGLAGLPGITLDPDTVETNIVVFGLTDAEQFCARLEAEHNVRMGALGSDVIRAVTHHDVTTADVHHAVQAVSAVLCAAR